ncbi:Panacea domain-containing protein [Dyadobacter subterraneus]|uniref:DUF4065 domain-containing protein n=1 Tax=Dyadobacter subterraneus TaxID=2773304 RepID=A0ABR9WLU0_9BACT|nr:type II toxin-antitoxin system antitoxin SocA domain-containing protein [Dyadobacter subterraneus]MBE9466397.1 DUF4065 domain-containing protein [Dyadobacter subterraneus]
MVSAEVIAKEFVNKGIEEGDPVTQMKLQKMVFFAQGLHLALHQEILCNEPFYAWKFGPVVPSIYQLYKKWGSSPIVEKAATPESANTNNADLLTSSERETLDYTWEITKNLDGITLSNWSHAANSPWAQAYAKGENTIISNSIIKEYFEQNLIRQSAGTES